MSMNNLSMESEFRYMVNWFNEWSELQRDDFVPILVEYIVDDNNGPYMNGIENAAANVTINDKPMSLFQCRIKLFRQWSSKWPQEFKHKLKEKIMEIDGKVGEKIINEIKRHNDAHSNGNATLSEDEEAATSDEITVEEVRNVAVAIVNRTTEEAVNAVLNNNELAEQAQPEVLVSATVAPQTVTSSAEVPLVA